MEKLIGERDITFIEILKYNIKNLSTKIDFINNLDIDDFCKFIYNFSIKYFSSFKTSFDEIKERYLNFVNDIKINTSPTIIKNSIQLLYILLKYYKIFFEKLKDFNILKNKLDINLNDNTKVIFKNWLKNIKIEHPITYSKNEEIELKKNIEYLFILKNLNDPKNNIIYGSYINHLLDYDIVYNDIDLYCTDSFNYLICLIGLIYFGINKDISIMNIPFIEGYRALIYDNKVIGKKENIIIDCIQVDNFIFKKLTTEKIQNIHVINNVIQYAQNLRLYSIIQRRYKLSLDIESNYKKIIISVQRLNIKLKNIPIPNFELFIRINDNFQNVSKLKDKTIIFENPNFLKFTFIEKTFLILFNIPNIDNIDKYITEIFKSVKKKSMKFGAILNEDIYEGDNFILITYHQLEVYLDKNFELTHLSLIGIIGTILLYYQLHRYPNLEQLINLSYSLIQIKSNESIYLINRKKTEGDHLIINFPKKLYVSLYVKEETEEFYNIESVNNFKKIK